MFMYVCVYMYMFCAVMQGKLMYNITWLRYTVYRKTLTVKIKSFVCASQMIYIPQNTDSTKS